MPWVRRSNNDCWSIRRTLNGGRRIVLKLTSGGKEERNMSGIPPSLAVAYNVLILFIIECVKAFVELFRVFSDISKVFDFRLTFRIYCRVHL